MLAFFAKNQHFLAKIAPLLKAIVWELCLRLFNSVFSFCKIKGYYWWKCKFYRLCFLYPASGLLQIGHKLRKWQWRHNLPTWRHRQIFLRCFIFVVNFSYWVKFHVNIMTCCGVMTVFFYKGLTRTPEIGNTPVWVRPNIWRLGWVRDTKFYTNVSNKMLLNAAKCQGYSFWVTKEKPTREVKLLPPPKLGLNIPILKKHIWYNICTEK